MNPVYVVLGGLFWRVLNKKIALWYTHKNVDWKLRVAEKITNIIFSASKESFRLESKKLQITGHGIDTEFFKSANHPRGEYLQICSVARISPTKNQKIMIEVIKNLKQNGFKAKLYVAGSAITEKDKIYENEIRELVVDEELSEDVIFVGNILPEKMPEFLQKMDILINLSNTGSMDKAVLEAMSCGLRVLTSNIAFASVLSKNNFTDQNLADISLKLKSIISAGLDLEARQYIVLNHNLFSLVKNLSDSIKLKK